MDRDMPVFVISVAAQLAQMHPQTLRQYDRLGLVVPQRQQGKHRRYSSNDIARLRRIQQLSTEGVSLEGIRRMIGMEHEAEQLRRRVRELEQQLNRVRFEGLATARVFAAGAGGEVSIKANEREARARRVAHLHPFERTSIRRGE